MTNQTRRVLLAAPAVWLCATLLVASQNSAAPASTPQPQAPAAAPAAVPAASPVTVPANPDEAYKDDVHQQAGVTCASCHGTGAPGPIDRTKIASLCASCHSDPTYMRKFRPQVRTDQHAQYVTSVHGMQMVKGETRVATCSDCHNAHGVRPVKDARSPVAPVNVAQTCAKCHADANRMTPFNRDPAVRRLVAQCACGGLVAAGRYVGSHVQHVPWQPRRHASGHRLGGQHLFDVPCARSRAVSIQHEARGV
ncbi:MAG: cytochrome c3 family protein [Acidobacteria bacterium]|nr:cytochrome c3 family protein [Acidobacteriota bacterium]